MRVTQQTIQDQWVQNIQKRLQSMDQLNRQIGSGVRVQNPSDDPAGASRLVRIEEAVGRSKQYLRNIDDALAVNGFTESVLGQVDEHMVRAKTLALEGANDASVPIAASFATLADEVAGIKTGLLQLGGSRYQDKQLFSGTAGEKPPFGADGGRYQGDSNRRRTNIGNGQTVAVNLPGDVAFRETAAYSAEPLADTVTLNSVLAFEASDGTVDVSVSIPAAPAVTPVTYTRQELAEAIDQQLQDAGANLQTRIHADGTLSIGIADTLEGGELTLQDDPSTPGTLASVLGITPGTKNLFGLLDDLQSALESEDPEQVNGMLGRLDRALEDINTQRGLLGARSRNLRFARDRIEANNVTTEALQAEIEGVDLPEAVVRISSEEQAYQTALAAGARIFNVSIIDFLR
jgi:flagellar hook-associated protein 3 FlgL